MKTIDDLIKPPTKTIEFTTFERHIMWIACRFLNMARSTKDTERATLDRIMTKIMESNGQENATKKIKQN